MTVKGRVLSVYGNMAEVLVIRKSACGENCANCLSQCNQKNHIAKAKNTACAKIGDTAEVFLSDAISIKLLTLTFILPIILFITAYIATLALSDNHAVSGIISALVFICYLLLLRRHDEHLAPIPEIIGISENGKDEINGA